MISLSKLASWFIVVNAQSSSTEKLTQMKLMFLLYYVQGTYLALYDQKAFSNDILAWRYGPAIAQIHQHFRGKRVVTSNVTTQDEANYRAINRDDRLLKIVFEVQETFGHQTAAALSQQTMRERPWQSTLQSQVIDPAIIKDYFQKHVVEIEK
ncbi:Panacea domain-containing protein [Lentilactobacillus raoultii]|uniref:Panacea domain-containing protein n=1 Tax=Lentilactobacillus raoultii TaxID=1987503 RepID=A0ABW3PL77_9LACO|nr:type II toxin-antitoxin system antitoxin SocA domain-containing protein [Lentilactobacillus raoultii]